MKMYIVGIIGIMSLLFAGCTSTVERGTTFLEEEKYEEAEEKFQKAVEKEKDLDEAYRGLGICYFEQQEYEKALEAFEHAIEHGTKVTASLYNLMGHCAAETDNFENAAEYFAHGQTFADADEGLAKEMALNEILVYEQMEDYEQAREKLEEYVKQYPEDEEAAKELEFWHTQLPEE